MSDAIADFIDFLHKNGMPPAMPREIQADDRIRRFTTEGDRKGSKNGVFRLAINGEIAFGWVRSHKESRTITYFSGSTERMTDEQRALLKAQYEQRKQANAQNRIDEQEKTARLAEMLWSAAQRSVVAHPYAFRKGVDLTGVRVSREITTNGLYFPSGEILVPLYDVEQKRLWNVQRIDAKGGKKFLPGGRLTGLYHPIGRKVCMKAKPYIFCEGWATGKTLWRLLECPVLCAMNAGNLLPVAKAFRRERIYARFLFAADNDQWTMKPQDKARLYPDLDVKALSGTDPHWPLWRSQGLLINTGLDKATEAARAVNGLVVPAALPACCADKLTDWNDVYNEFDGAARVRQAFASFVEF